MNPRFGAGHVFDIYLYARYIVYPIPPMNAKKKKREKHIWIKFDLSSKLEAKQRHTPNIRFDLMPCVEGIVTLTQLKRQI